MKRFFSLISVFILIFAAVSCGDKKKVEKPAYEEQVTKEISAEEGGTVESSDGKTSIEVPAGAVDENLTITMTIYDAKGYTGTEGQKVVSKVVEFEPSGTVFKKPIIITMAASEEIKGKVFSAAVYRESVGEWSYNEHGAYAVLAGRDAAGDPIMQSAAGDPIMLSAAGDPIMMSAAGDPIMMAAAGDPIMLASAGDPIMSNAAGDPIMNAAAGDPIMMTTGHFTAYTFIILDEPTEPVEGSDDDSDDADTSDEEIADEDDEDTEITDEDDDVVEIAEDDDEIPDEIEDEDENPVVDEDEDIDTTPAEPPVYSKVLCTGQTRCKDKNNSLADCPAEGEELYGQDAQFVAAKTCVLHKYSRQSEPVEVEEEDPEEGEGTGLRNILHGKNNNKNVKRGLVRSGETGESYEFVLDENTGLKWVFLNENGLHSDAENRCDNLTYGGHEWRLPTVKEFLSIADHDRFASATNEFYFRNLGYWGFWTSEPALAADDYYQNPFWVFNSDYGTLESGGIGQYGSPVYNITCVTGEEYGKPGEYEVKNIGGKEVVFDPSTNLLWQKDSKQVETWKDALAYCKNLVYAGYSDWRLPNKNELVTLVDYSKVEPASSFPGMTSDKFITSTFQVSYGSAADPFAIDMKSGRIEEYDSYDDDDNPDNVSVRCVRSDSQPQPAGIRECDESRIAPCKDASTGYVWSSADVDSNYSRSASWFDKAMQCRASNEGGISKWRLPTIDEIRTLLPSSENLKPDGECKVTNECFDYASESCFNEAVCSPEAGGEMIMSSLFDYSGYLTGTLTDAGDTDYAWFVNLRTGALKSMARNSYLTSESRCIKDDSLPDPVAFPYIDSAHSLIWSSLYNDFDYWSDVAKYCKELVEGGSNNWRVPSIDELKTLVKNCTDAEGCSPSIKGEYSVFGDISDLWSSTIDDGSNIHILQFMTAYDKIDSIDSYVSHNVRCVRGTDEPETEPELEFPFEIGDLIWSDISDEEFWNAEGAVEYCNSLSAEGYGGRTDWTLPSTADLVALLKKSVCGNKNDLFAANGSCNQYSFDGYSVFDDMVRLMGSDGYIDFAQGSVYYSNYPYGSVRCIVVLPDSGS